ncbi:MAG: hypothetical protein QG552_1611 [Thermodesulfobacteriota bacterium]|nr:hypothetical protein [Thermodesulfobacteriota bacterium]
MERVAYTIYLTVLILSILLFGGMHTYAYTLMSLGVLTATVLVLIKNIRKGHRTGSYQLRLPRSSLNLAFFVLLTFLIFQVIPLPDGVLKALSPEAAVVAAKSFPASELANQAQVEKGWFSLAPYRYPVRMSIIRLTVYGLVFFGMIQVLNSRKRIDLAIWLILITGCFDALYGLMQTYSGSEHIWWFKKQAYKGDVCGTYINRNHFAGLMEMGMLLAAAFAAALAPTKKKTPVSKDRKRPLASRISDVLSREEEFTKRILILFSGVVLGIGLIFSASRGGMLAAAGAMFLMGLLYVFRKGFRRNGLILLGLFVVIAGYSLNIGVEYPMDRFKSFHSTYEARTRLARNTISMFDDYKLVGVGVGSFKYVFPKYQPVEEKQHFVRFAHNDLAQYLAEAGIIGACLLLFVMAYYVFRTVKMWRTREDPYAVSLGALPLVALACMAVHSYSDFNLHIPANFMVLVAIMAIGYAALHLERHHRRERMSYRYYEWPIRYRGAVVLVLIFGLIGWAGYTSIRHFMAEAYCNTVPNSTLNRDPYPPIEEVVKAIEWDGGNAEYWYNFAERIAHSAESIEDESSKLKAEREDEGTGGLIKEGEKIRGLEGQKDGWLDEWMREQGAGSRGQGGKTEAESSKVEAQSSKLKGENAKGISHRGTEATEEGALLRIGENRRNLRIMVGALEKSVELNPFEAQYHLRLGWGYAHQWQEKDYYTKWLPAADISMDRAAYFAGVKNPHLHQELGNYWVMRSKSVYPNNPVHHEAWAKAVWHYRRAQSAERGAQSGESAAVKQMKKEIQAYVWNFYPDEGFVAQTMISAHSK